MARQLILKQDKPYYNRSHCAIESDDGSRMIFIELSEYEEIHCRKIVPTDGVNR
jgi:hypothetical protein